MVTLTFDAIVIGTGQTGPSLAARLASEGKQVAIIDTPLPRGASSNDSSTPLRALGAIARAAHQTQNAKNFGVGSEGDTHVDMQEVHERLDEISDKVQKSARDRLHNLDRVTVIRRQARFEANDTIRCGEQLLQADQIFVNVGGQPIVPATFADIGSMTSSDIMNVTLRPEHLIVAGGSDRGLAYAQIFRRFGSEVTLLEREARILPQEDESLSQYVHELLIAEGVRIRTNAECLTGRRSDDRIAVQLACSDHPEDLEGSHLLLAFGRQPNTADLGLQNTDVAINKHGFIRVDSSLKTTAEGVWAVGDCIASNSPQNTLARHHALDASQLLDEPHQNRSKSHLFYPLLIDPPVGRVGINKQAARDSGRNVMIGHQRIDDCSGAAEHNKAHGFFEVLIDRDSEEILGATIHGIAGDEAAHSLLNMMHAGTSSQVFATPTSMHPTIAELLPKMLQSLQPLV